MTGVLPDHWQPAMRDMRSEWSSLVPAPATVLDWETALGGMANEMARAKARGRWRAGRADLLYAAGRGGDELVHSNVLSWLLSPSARHGLGPAFLVDLVKRTWGVPLYGADIASVRREVHRSSRTRKRIADLIVAAGGTRLVIENKVYSDEDNHQCEDLYRLWTAELDDDDSPEQVLFVLLSRHGRDPWSVDTAEAAAAWKGLRWEWVEGWLRDHVHEIDSTVARSTVVQYIASLRPITRRTGS